MNSAHPGDPTHPMSNDLIKRCAQALCYTDETSLIDELVKEGLEESFAYLAVMAGKVYARGAYGLGA